MQWILDVAGVESTPDLSVSVGEKLGCGKSGRWGLVGIKCEGWRIMEGWGYGLGGMELCKSAKSGGE